ncbi:MAG: sulfatase-like hydrolase/transferase [Lachnospiraceae bacterium]|nr:sulfatase-like hydrolase/transferase [Lachnospiraceae bacterium]
MIVSVGDFAGRSSYFRGHGNYAIEDYDAAIEKGRIPSDYKVWWGYEDKKLFDFAKEDITKLAEQDEPFNFTMLTVDTHFTDGYECDLCEDEYGTQYSNVIACSSKQVAEFVNWIKKQDFYENTTIVIAGDHLTMDSAYINNEGVAGFDRKMYFNIVNPADGKVNKNGKRIYTSLDLYPTTLSSLGVEIEGNRLGLGVDLYSDTSTIVEEKGLDYLNTELMKNSEYYTKELLYKQRTEAN